ncbi:MAG: tetratricopeptide repeat protein [Desulfobulbaceae bacterium]|nr:tetratricopeptide repeat protein [Desulfobulbaceae bacterium]
MRFFFQRFSPGTDKPVIFLLRSICIVFLVTAGLFHVRAAFLTQLSLNQGPHMETFSHSLTHPDALAGLARKEFMLDADLTSALTLYRRALAHFVLHLPSWLGLAEVLHDMGKENEAAEALHFVHDRFPNNQDIAWSKALLAGAMGRESILAENLVWLADNSPARKKEVIAMGALTWQDPEALMRVFGSAFYTDILLQYITNDAFNKTVAVWEKIVESGSVQQRAALQYVDYLVGQHAYLLAARVWAETTGPDTPLLYNGTFEKPLLNSAFGWRISATKGTSWQKGDYGSGLEITFDGTENAVFQLSQTLPLNPGRYVLSGTVETDDLRTDQLPFWTVQGVQCTGLNARSEMVLPNQHATEFILPFVVPDNCELVRIALVRKKSFHFDNKIGGKVTVSSLNVRPAESGASPARQTFSNTTGEPDNGDREPGKTDKNIAINPLLVQP